MANYSVDIELAVKGQEQLKALEKQISSLEQAAKRLRTIEVSGATKFTTSELEKQAKLYKESVEDRRKAFYLANKELETERRISEVLDKRVKQEQSRKQLGSAISSGVIGGAFPLLFGQGVGASIGGATGGFLGGLKGGQGGFGGSLVGTFAGQATIDFAINSVIQLGTALKKPTDNIQQLTQYLGIAGTKIDTTISVLQGLGLEAVAASVAVEELQNRLGAQGFKDVKGISKDLQDFDNTMRDLRLAAALAATKFKPLLDFLTQVVGIAAKAGLPRGGPLGTVSNVALATSGQPAKTPVTGTTQQVTADRLAETVMANRIAVAKGEVSLERERLSLGRVALADLQGQLQVQRISADLEEKKLNLLKEQDPARRKLLDLEVKITEQQKQQAEAARRNAVIEAQRQVQKELNSLEVQKLGVSNEINQLAIQRVSLQRGELAGMQAADKNLQNELNEKAQALALQRDSALIGVNEASVRREINELYKGQLQQLILEIGNRKVSLEQQQAGYNLTQLQIKQQRELNNLQTESQYKLQLKSLQAQKDMRFMGPFGGPMRTQELMTLEAQNNLLNMQSQLAAVQAQAAVPGLSPDNILKLQQQSQSLSDQIVLYKQYQPAIIEATVAQERFNEAMGYTRPVVDGVFESMLAVAQSTKTTEQAFADFLQNIASMLFDIGKQIIAQYIAIGIARMFAGIPAAGGNTNALYGAGAPGAIAGGGIFTGAGPFQFRAAGGPVSAGKPYIVGERGPEMFVPHSSGTIYPNSALGGGVQVGSVNITVQNTGDKLSPAAQKEIANQVQGIVMSTLVNQKRSGGIL